MSAIYDNWERLVAAVVKKQQLWELFHQQSRSPSILSEASDFTSSLGDLDLDLLSPGSSSRSHISPSKLVLISEFCPAFDVNDVALASYELIGKGAFGSVYAVTTDDGQRFVVKRLIKSVGMSEFDFKRNMEIVGDVKHEKVVALRAYYSSTDEKLMLYDYYNNRSVSSLLHGQNRAHVDWETRLSIAIDAARGIAEIHRQLGGMLVHGNIKASNIFVNHKGYGCVSDLGLTNMMQTEFMPTARCYAPEVKNTQHVSQASDVYSFGILLLELLTRKPTADVPGGPKAVHIVKLVKSVKSKERAAKVFDVFLLKDHSKINQMVTVLQIGMQCVAKSRKKRPTIFEVVNMLENIIISSNIRKKLVFVEDDYTKFVFEDMLRASVKRLGKGNGGTCYKATVGNRNIGVVKRMNIMKEFQTHMALIAASGHKNVDALKACSFSSDEVLLGYDYYHKASLSSLLHGLKGGGMIHLKWATRVEIALGAAKGISHIHRQDGGKLFHGNINSSNIFLSKRTVVVSDAELITLTTPINLHFDLGCSAPEVEDSSKATQASDVYSFGVVLLQLISGRPPRLTTTLVQWIQHHIRNNWTAQVIDVELKRYQPMEELLRFLRLAMDCVSFLPEHRPRMPQVVEELEKIGGINKLVQSGLERVLEDLFHRLTPQ